MKISTGVNEPMVVSDFSKMRGHAFCEWARARLQGHAADSQAMAEGDHVLNPGYHAKVVELAVKPAAVLLPVIQREDGLKLIFTKRTEKLKSHSGQISFPGGRIDAGDANPEMAALRETHEEIGVCPENVQVLGQMPDYFTGSGYQISCVVGMVDSNVQFVPNPDEVDYIFEVPLAFLMNPDNHNIGSRVFEKIERHFYEMPWGKHYIWGVTAGIVRMFYNRVFK